MIKRFLIDMLLFLGFLGMPGLAACWASFSFPQLIYPAAAVLALRQILIGGALMFATVSTVGGLVVPLELASGVLGCLGLVAVALLISSIYLLH
jgi:hypothetical protein